MDYQDNNPSTYVDPREHKALDVQDFLRKIAILESNSGQNLNHPQVTTGINKGTNATGQYGLMPITAMDIDRQAGHPYFDDNYSPELVQKVLEKNPEIGDTLAATMASNLLAKNPQDVAAYKWLHGQYSNPSQEELDKSSRVKQFRALSNLK